MGTKAEHFCQQWPSEAGAGRSLLQVVRWVAAIIAVLGLAFACAALTWRYGLVLLQTPPGSGNRLGLAVGVGTVVSAVSALPLASWASSGRSEAAQLKSSVSSDGWLHDHLDLPAEPVSDCDTQGSSPRQRSANRLPVGWPITETKSPIVLGVHKAFSPGTKSLSLPELPRYVPRPHDQRLKQLIDAAQHLSQLKISNGGSYRRV